MNPLAWIANFLQAILCAILKLAWVIGDVGMIVVNAVIALLGEVASVILGLFPDLPGGGVEGIAEEVLTWANWLFPIGAILSLFTGYLALYVAARMLMAAVRVADKLGVVDRGR